MISPLPSMEHTFTVDIKGSKTGRTYSGKFTYKIPNLLQEAEIEKTYLRLSEGLELSEYVSFLYEAVAYLNNTLIKSPEWWAEELSSLDTLDYNVYTELYTECLKFKNNWGKEDESESGKDNKISG